MAVFARSHVLQFSCLFCSFNFPKITLAKHTYICAHALIYVILCYNLCVSKLSVCFLMQKCMQPNIHLYVYVVNVLYYVYMWYVCVWDVACLQKLGPQAHRLLDFSSNIQNVSNHCEHASPSWFKLCSHQSINCPATAWAFFFAVTKFLKPRFHLGARIWKFPRYKEQMSKETWQVGQSMAAAKVGHKTPRCRGIWSTLHHIWKLP